MAVELLNLLLTLLVSASTNEGGGKMPYEYKRNRAEVEPLEELPHNLQHRPVYALPYQHFDGPFSEKTDARYISVGLAQWNHGEVSVKVFRHTGPGGKWTRQSEELPMHRVIDAALFLAKVVFDRDTVDESVTLPAGTFEGQKADLIITSEDVPGMTGNFKLYLNGADNANRTKARYRALYEVLNELHDAGKL